MRALVVIFMLPACAALAGDSGATVATGGTSELAKLAALARTPAATGSDGEIEKALRDALARDGGTGPVADLLGKWLFSRSRFQEALPLLRESCEAGHEEKVCAAAAATLISREDWSAAARVAEGYLRKACEESDRLRTVALLGKEPRAAVLAGESLRRNARDDEMSYLVLAAAQRLAGLEGDASRTIEDGLGKARNVRLLRSVGWGRSLSKTTGP